MLLPQRSLFEVYIRPDLDYDDVAYNQSLHESLSNWMEPIQ